MEEKHVYYEKRSVIARALQDVEQSEKLGDIDRMACFTLGTMKGLTYMQLLTYSNATNIYQRVESYNSNVSTLRASGDTSKTYYTFNSSEEESKYKLGRFLLIQNDPTGDYTPVKKN